jgi:hypothetical protein
MKKLLKHNYYTSTKYNKGGTNDNACQCTIKVLIAVTFGQKGLKTGFSLDWVVIDGVGLFNV